MPIFLSTIILRQVQIQTTWHEESTRAPPCLSANDLMTLDIPLSLPLRRLSYTPDDVDSLELKGRILILMYGFFLFSTHFIVSFQNSELHVRLCRLVTFFGLCTDLSVLAARSPSALPRAAYQARPEDFCKGAILEGWRLLRRSVCSHILLRLLTALGSFFELVLGPPRRVS